MLFCDWVWLLFSFATKNRLPNWLSSAAQTLTFPFREIRSLLLGGTVSFSCSLLKGLSLDQQMVMEDQAAMKFWQQIVSHHGNGLTSLVHFQYFGAWSTAL